MCPVFCIGGCRRHVLFRMYVCCKGFRMTALFYVCIVKDSLNIYFYFYYFLSVLNISMCPVFCIGGCRRHVLFRMYACCKGFRMTALFYICIVKDSRNVSVFL
jgi:hypothetical protein